MSETVRTGNRRPPWGLIAVILGVALAAFLCGALQLLRPGIVRTRHSDGIAAFNEWQFPFETALEGEPQLTETEDGSVQLTGVYSSPQSIDPIILQVSCQTLDTPPTWRLIDCSILPDRPEAFTITIER